MTNKNVPNAMGFKKLATYVLVHKIKIRNMWNDVFDVEYDYGFMCNIR